MNTITVQTSLDTINCGQCGGIYAIQTRFRERCQQEGSSWNCPYCKVGWGYSGNSDNSKLKKQLAEAEAEKERLRKAAQYQRERRDEALAEAEHFRRSRDGMKGVVAKIKKRVGRGVCPCCNRHFANLQRHMESQHPEVASGEVNEG